VEFEVSRSEFVSIVTVAMKIRKFEERLLSLFSEGKIRGTVHTCIGQELIPAALATSLIPEDMVFGTHRGHGYYLALTHDYSGLAREILGKHRGTTNGLGGSQHLLGPQIVTNGIQGGMIPLACGFASQLESGISVAVIGDGTLGSGLFYETLNIAKLEKVPLLVILEDNGVAQSTPTQNVIAGEIGQRVESFGVKYFQSDDTDLRSLTVQMIDAVDFVRSDREPALIHLKTNRLGPHSKGDDNRPVSYLRELRERDSLTRCIEIFGVEDGDLRKIDGELEEVFEGASAEGPAFVTIDPLANARQLDERRRTNNSLSMDSGDTIRAQITQALEFSLSQDSATVMLGEDIETLPSGMEKNYSGAFGISGGLSISFPGRVKNFPISEAAMVGFGIGRAFGGKPTIVEIMFSDFMTLVVDQIRQQATKLVGVYGRSIPLPFLVRTPVGGRRGYGPTHSQNFETLFFGVPNLIVFVVSPFGVSKEVFSDLLSIGSPVTFFEDKDLYLQDGRPQLPPSYEVERGGSLRAPFKVYSQGRSPKLTLVSYGSAASLCLSAIRELAILHEVFVDFFVYEVLNPFDEGPVLESLTQTRSLLLVEEGLSTEGLASVMMARLSQEGLGFPVRWGSLGAVSDIGASEVSEDAARVTVDKIVGRALDMV